VDGGWTHEGANPNPLHTLDSQEGRRTGDEMLGDVRPNISDLPLSIRSRHSGANTASLRPTVDGSVRTTKDIDLRR